MLLYEAGGVHFYFSRKTLREALLLVLLRRKFPFLQNPHTCNLLILCISFSYFFLHMCVSTIPFPSLPPSLFLPYLLSPPPTSVHTPPK
jgi:hypothetical protein